MPPIDSKSAGFRRTGSGKTPKENKIRSTKFSKFYKTEIKNARTEKYEKKLARNVSHTDNYQTTIKIRCMLPRLILKNIHKVY